MSIKRPQCNRQGWQRNIVMDGSPHLPANIRQWYGDSRGHREDNTLVVDVTNFSPKTDFMGSRENLHLVERWTHTSPTSLEYAVRIYYEPRCNEGNFGLPGLLHGRQARAIRPAPHPCDIQTGWCKARCARYSTSKR
jgi:hypothetical protein